MSAAATTATKPAAPVIEQIRIKVDGREIEVPRLMPDWQGKLAATTMIQACSLVNVDVPHYCYHPKLPVAGNCRMCLVEFGTPAMGPDRKPVMNPDGTPKIAKSPRPAIACATPISPGMEIYTNTPGVKQMREGVLEFLLINHPLDCPICDQAGECKLQEYSVDYGQATSRFAETKVHKPKHVDLGPRIVLDDERCILCTRCIRFSRDIAHDDALGIVNRGSYNTLSAYPGKAFDNNYTLNTVDICPVGALTSKDFRFQMRVWFLKETKSVCTSCATGCNTIVGSREDVIYRQTPRQNDYVNSCWMCDYGRLNFKYLEAETRLVEPRVRLGGKLAATDWPTAIAHAALQLKETPASDIAIIASARMTNEELWLTSQLAKSLGVRAIDIVPRREAGDNILLSEDRNPNTNGARLILGSDSEPGAKLMTLADAVRSGQIKALAVLGENAMHLGLTVEQLARLPTLIMMDILENEATECATVVLPSCGFAEKRGSMVNGRGRLQRLNRAVRPPGNARDDWEILRDLLQAVGGGDSLHSVDQVFRRLSETVPQFAGLTLNKIGDMGVQILQMEEVPPVPPKDQHAIEMAIAIQARRRAERAKAAS